MNLWYGRDGQPITVQEWEESFRDNSVAKTTLNIPGHDTTVLISTVWLGLDHSLGNSERPLIFESMCFFSEDGDYDWLGELCERYSTEAEALAGHEAMVNRVRALLGSEAEKEGFGK